MIKQTVSKPYPTLEEVFPVAETPSSFAVADPCQVVNVEGRDIWVYRRSIEPEIPVRNDTAKPHLR